MEFLESRDLLESVKVVRMGVPDMIVSHGDANALLAEYGLNADGIYQKTLDSAKELPARKVAGKPLRAVK